MRAKAGDDIRQSEPIAESIAVAGSATFIRTFSGNFFGNRKIGSGAYGRRTANKTWVSRNVFFSPAFSD
jgi:hypothetical protein